MLTVSSVSTKEDTVQNKRDRMAELLEAEPAGHGDAPESCHTDSNVEPAQAG